MMTTKIYRQSEQWMTPNTINSIVEFALILFHRLRNVCGVCLSISVCLRDRERIGFEMKKKKYSHRH